MDPSVPEEEGVEVVLGSVQPLAPAKVPLRPVRGLVLAEPVTPGHGLPFTSRRRRGFERAAG